MAEITTERGKGKVQVFDTEDDLSVSLAKYTADLSDKFAKERGAFTVVVSGGSLIKSLRKLVEPPYIDSVEWSKWHMFWVDERVVPKDHEDSNYKLAFDGFLSKVPIPPSNVYAINDALSAEGAADDYETCLKHLVKMNIIDVSQATGFPKFDVMLLGMGPDGHVASLFPGHPLVQANEQWVAFIKDSPKPPPERITFTFPVINSSANIALVVAGAGKADVVNVALGNGQSSNLLPVQMVSPEGELTWFLDKGAASKL
jgi:6-phosphogluconolactonase